ncbi:MAG: GNAT family N-acetyltransferase [archaeon]|nr:GNAT family N-acetyltransferase [archaeon]
MCFVVEIGRVIVGSGFATHDGAFSGYIQKVAVGKPFRRQKIATQLIQKQKSNFKWGAD